MLLAYFYHMILKKMIKKILEHSICMVFIVWKCLWKYFLSLASGSVIFLSFITCVCPSWIFRIVYCIVFHYCSGFVESFLNPAKNMNIKDNCTTKDWTTTKK